MSSPHSFKNSFASLKKSFGKLPVSKYGSLKLDLSNALQKDNEKRLGILQFSRLIGESLCKLLQEDRIKPYDLDFEVLKRVAILLFYAPFASSSQKTGSTLPSQSIFDDKELKVFQEIENWKNTVVSKLTVTNNRPPTENEAFSPFGKEIKGLHTMEGEMLDYSIEVSHPAVLAYVYLLATKAQNYVKQSLTNKERSDDICSVWNTLSDTDEVSFFYVQYYQMLCDYENPESIMLLSDPNDAQTKMIGSFSEFQVALNAAKLAKNISQGIWPSTIHCCEKCSTVLEHLFLAVACSSCVNAVELLEGETEYLTQHLPAYLDFYKSTVLPLKTESYDFIGNNIKSFIEGSDQTHAMSAENLETLFNFCGDAHYVLLGQLNQEIVISAENKKKEEEKAKTLPKLSLREKKARKALMKDGLKHVPEITHAVIKQQKLLLKIPKADVYILPGTNTYVIFGAVKTESADKLSEAVSSFTKEEEETKESEKVEKAEEEEDNLDETGLDAADIDVIISNSGVTRARAIKALRENKGDIVNAIMVKNVASFTNFFSL